MPPTALIVLTSEIDRSSNRPGRPGFLIENPRIESGRLYGTRERQVSTTRDGATVTPKGDWYDRNLDLGLNVAQWTILSGDPREVPVQPEHAVCVLVTTTEPLSFETTASIAVAAKNAVPGAVGTYVSASGQGNDA